MSLINTLTGPVLGILDKFVEDKDAESKNGPRDGNDGRQTGP